MSFSLGSRNIFTIRVGKSDASQADWFVAEQADVLRLLRKIRAYAQPC